MRFTVAVSTTDTHQGQRDRAVVVEELEHASLEFHLTGPVLEIRGEWNPVMEALRRAHERLSARAVSVNFHLTVSSDHGDAFPEGIPGEDALRASITEERVATSDDHVAAADRESFPASDPPGTRPGST